MGGAGVDANSLLSGVNSAKAKLTQRLLLLLHPGLDLPYRCPRLIQLFQSEKLVGTQTRIQFEKSVWTSSQPPCM
ncbi:unnamed protein product [Pleuronectes platessa]|uniref:Uncharacterized protein n=1 Tax=Pleuronectes platessa TaxID=8262 RepID=A0A9N7V3P4_PLEPL|nr:unnamed protein product [Pleuronectes platessa]